MNPIKFAMRRPVTSLVLVVAVTCGGVYGLYKMRLDIPWLHTSKVYAYLDFVGEKATPIKTYIVDKYEATFHKHKEEGEAHHEEHKLVVTRPIEKPVKITQEYVCQIHSQRHIDVIALQDGYLEPIPVKEGQTVKAGDLMFKVIPTLYQAKLDAEVAEADFALQEYNNSKALASSNAVSAKQVALHKAKLAKAEANVKLAQAELNFTEVRAPFDGIVDRLMKQQGTLIKEGDILTTLSDNSVMWVYFNVNEKRYIEYKNDKSQNKDDPNIKLVLANHDDFSQEGKIGTIEAQFNNQTGTIMFRADFPNPDGLLRHGQTGKVLINRELPDAIVIPQRATFENLAKRYVYVVGEDDKVHQREIAIQYELEDVYVIKNNPKADKSMQLGTNDRIILEGIRQVREGEKVEFEFREPQLVLATPKPTAE